MEEFEKSPYTDCNASQVYTAGIDVNGWTHRIEIHGNTQAEAEALRDKVLAALVEPK